MINGYEILVGRPVGKNNLEDIDVDGRVVLKCILEKYGVRVWTGLI